MADLCHYATLNKITPVLLQYTVKFDICRIIVAGLQTVKCKSWVYMV